MILVFAGPNGSGKSTITQYFDKVGTYTNADEIVAATGMSNEDAAVFADKKRYEAIESKEDFTFETVLSSHYKLDILRKAKENGYFIKCIFVLTNDPLINVSRVETRVASGGHNVDKDKIISRYLENWSLNRLGQTDRAILRLSAYEMLYYDTPKVVVINEAIELAKSYSDDSVRKMINAVLDRYMKENL